MACADRIPHAGEHSKQLVSHRLLQRPSGGLREERRALECAGGAP